MADRTAYGGQAVIEGVMIRGKERVATAVRLNDGSIAVRREMADGWTKGKSWLRLAFVRGTPALIDSLRLGYRTLMWSADQTMEGEGQKKPNALQYTFSIVLALAIGIGVFMLAPTWVIGLIPGTLHAAAGANIWSQLIPTWPALLHNISEGVLRVLMLVGYIFIIGRMKDIQRVFQYHGAEHKVVNGWEAGAELTVEDVRKYSRIHPRCGTSFLFLFFVVGILVHALIGWPNWWLRGASRLMLLPVVAGLAYELIRLAGRKRDSLILRILVWPGMLLQRMTTSEPSDDQIEVAIASMRAVLEDEGVLQHAPAPAAPLSPAAS